MYNLFGLSLISNSLFRSRAAADAWMEPIIITNQEKSKMKAYLRIKVKSIAEEQRIIRAAERHWRKRARHTKAKFDGEPPLPAKVKVDRAYATFFGLQGHRHELRHEQRAAFIAYGFIRGRAYREIENDPHYLRPTCSRPGPDWKRVAELIVKFGEGKHSIKELPDELKAWSKRIPNAVDASEKISA